MSYEILQEQTPLRGPYIVSEGCYHDAIRLSEWAASEYAHTKLNL